MKRTNEKMILIIEDDEPKLRSIYSFLGEVLNEGAKLISTESLTSAIEKLSTIEIDLAIVDMSIPTFDFVKDRRGGGQPQGFGGADILRFIDSETSNTKSVVVTQYEEFFVEEDGKRRDPRGLEALLRKELDERFLGVIHYSGQHGDWRNALLKILNEHNLTK